MGNVKDNLDYDILSVLCDTLQGFIKQDPLDLVQKRGSNTSQAVASKQEVTHIFWFYVAHETDITSSMSSTLRNADPEWVYPKDVFHFDV